MLFFVCLSIKRNHDFMMMMKTNNICVCYTIYTGLTDWTLDMEKERKIIKIKANETSFYIFCCNYNEK